MPNWFEKNFEISQDLLKSIIRDFHSEMDNGLRKQKSSLKMLPTYVDRPCGLERGKFLALDLGGTNLRVLSLELKGKGKIVKGKEKKFILGTKQMNTNAQELFDFLALCIKDFLIENNISLDQKVNLGFTFSFPVKQMAINSGSLIKWTKEFTASGVEGKNVVELLKRSLERKGISGIKVAALVNDTVGTLACRSYADQDCDVGVILGTGTNACYREKIKSHHMIINIEWGNFNKLPRTPYDLELDEMSSNKGEQILEKEVSGMYLGKIAGLMIEDLLKIKLNNFTAEHISQIESDHSQSLNYVRRLFQDLGAGKLDLEDRKVIKKICRVVTARGARISAAVLAAVITKIDPGLYRRHTVAMDGSLYEKHPLFAADMKNTLKELLGQGAKRIKITLTKDGSGLGAAIIAAVAAKN